MVGLRTNAIGAFESDLLIYINRLSDLLFVMARARATSAAGTSGNRVVNSELAGAYAYCERLARTHYENFPVASQVAARRACDPTSPRSTRSPVSPTTSPTKATGRRAERLADSGRVGRLSQRRGARRRPARRAAREVFLALRHTIEDCRLPRQPLHDLIDAFRQDVTTTRYRPGPTCSTTAAAPPTRLAGSCSGSPATTMPVLDARSDAVCTALQLTNFWQDLAIDWRSGRIYLPLEEGPTGAREADLDAGGSRPNGRRRSGRCAARTTATVRGRPAGLRRRARQASLGASRRRGLARTLILDKLVA